MHPNQLIATKQRDKLAAANKALCYLTRGSFKEDQHTQASPTCVCLSLRLFVNCLARRRRSALKKQQRESEEQEEDAEAATAEHEEDRSPAAGEENLGASAVYRAMADLAGVRGSR